MNTFKFCLSVKSGLGWDFLNLHSDFDKRGKGVALSSESIHWMHLLPIEGNVFHISRFQNRYSLNSLYCSQNWYQNWICLFVCSRKGWAFFFASSPLFRTSVFLLPWGGSVMATLVQGPPSLNLGTNCTQMFTTYPSEPLLPIKVLI